MRPGHWISPTAATVTVVLSMRSSGPKTAPSLKYGPRSNIPSELSSGCSALPRCAIAGSKRTRITCSWPVRLPICSSRAAISCAAAWRNLLRSATTGCRRHKRCTNNDTTAPTLSLIATISMPDVHSQLLVQTFLSGIEPVQTRQQRGLQARRDRQWRQRSVEHIRVVRLAQQIAFYQRLGQLLDKQRYAIRALDNAVDNLCRQWLVTGDVRRQRCCLRRAEAVQQHQRDVSESGPRRYEFRPKRDQHQDRQTFGPFDHHIQ